MLFVDILKMLASALHLGESSSNCLMIFVYQALRPKAPILYRQMKKKKKQRRNMAPSPLSFDTLSYVYNEDCLSL